ncbi:hypothetical protein [Altererythrobacter sp. ZODW24]|uniref:hypothetical protein n=1 Tax=Altererythrobacter sp. ZODW24 TaxID=2185142 RepID=UPI000DF75651|nr:hypothetical protein [Altererythrobacter sp. ZODW24]
MKFTAIARVAAPALLLATAVSAQADEVAESATEAAAKFSTNLPIEALMADEAAAAVVEKHMPGLSEHPAYGQFKAMSLRQVQPFSQGMVTDEMLAAIDADLAALEG